jgi:hypothetical protein
MKRTTAEDRRKVIKAMKDFWKRESDALGSLGLVFDSKRVTKYNYGFGVFLVAERPGLDSTNLMLLLNEMTGYVQRKSGVFVVVMLDPEDEVEAKPTRTKKVA